MENSLTEREKEILELAGQNSDEKEIAEKLSISVHTVKSYLSKLRKSAK